jgi:biotin carboxylase
MWLQDLLCSAFEFVVTCGQTENAGRLVVIVDPVSTGAVLAAEATKRGFGVIAVWSECVPPELKAFVVKGLNIRYVGVVQHEEGHIHETARAVRALVSDHRRLDALMVGCETGVLLGDELAEALELRGNGTELSALRRNKWLQTEAVRKSGANACAQSLVTTMAEVDAVLRQWPAGAFKAVVKPVSGAGSDGVYICDSHAAVREAFLKLDGTRNVLGLTTYEVLIQEYLVGDEYVVDSVSLDGAHKCVAIWKYDKRVYNGSAVVYYGMRLLEIDDEPALRAMVAYTFGVLDQLGIRNGCMHSEIKLEPRGPVLIEVNCRIHGGEGTWAAMAQEAMGYSAVSALLDAYLRPEAFALLPVLPTGFSAVAMEAKLRSPVEGTLKSIHAKRMGQIRKLPSYRSEMLAVEPGKPISKTIDAVSACGNINLVHADRAQVEKDYATLHALVDEGLFTIDAGVAAGPPSWSSLASFFAQSPPSSPAVMAFKQFQPSPKLGGRKTPMSMSPVAPLASPMLQPQGAKVTTVKIS